MALRRALAGLISLLAMALLPSVVFAQAGDGCATTSLSPEQQVELRNLPGSPDATTFSCQNLTSTVSAEQRSARCITGACSGGGADRLCCLPSTGSRTTPTGGTSTSSPTTPVRPEGSLVLPLCVQDGSCGLDDIVQTGVNFANFLFGISGAIFLAIFVWAGFKYIWFSSNAGEIGKAKSMLVNATVGMLLIIGAGVLVNFVYQAVIGTGGGSGSSAENTCERNHPGYACTTLSSDPTVRDREITDRSCIRNQCLASPSNVICCPTSASTSP